MRWRIRVCSMPPTSRWVVPAYESFGDAAAECRFPIRGGVGIGVPSRPVLVPAGAWGARDGGVTLLLLIRRTLEATTACGAMLSVSRGWVYKHARDLGGQGNRRRALLFSTARGGPRDKDNINK